MLALATQARHFGLMSALAAQVNNQATTAAEPPSDYRALVCIFLSGGNDANNMIIPNHDDTTLSSYGVYSAARAPRGLAIARNQLLPISVPRAGGLDYGFHPNFGNLAGQPRGIHELWDQGKLAAVTNVGNLVRPTTRDQYRQRTVPLPYQLFSHSDQIAQQQAGYSGQRSYTGFGGRASDRLNPEVNPSGLVPMLSTIAGSALFTVGQTTSPLSLPTGSTALSNSLVLAGFGTDAASTARRAAFQDIRNYDRDSRVVNAAHNVTDAAVQASAALGTAVEVTVTFPNTGLGNQLKQVARVIKRREALQVTRQIFYCSIGGFDTHNGQLGGQGGLFTQISQAMRAFYDEMGVQGVQDNVTQFTLSDFGRTFNPAGTGAGVVGSDHAWGNHALVLGGGVRGGDFYGMDTTNGTPYPTLQFNGPDDADSGSGARGRWIPTTSVEQCAATLSRWYGLSESDMSNVFPNIGNFETSDLGFMSP